MPNYNNRKFYNIPREYSLRDYKESIDYLLQRYSKIKNIISIYEWGSVSIPGISDIDLVFVFKKTTDKALPLFKKSFYFLNKKIRYLGSHPFFFIDEETFHNVKYIYQKTNFRLLYGKDIKIKNLNAKEKYYANIALINDLIIRHYPRDFIEQSVDKTINVRDTLLRLNSLGYTIKTLKNLTKDGCDSWNQTLYRIKNLRKDWFKLKDFNEIALLNDEAVNISIDIIDIFRKFLLKNEIVKINSGEKVIYRGINNKSLFKKRWSKQEASKEMVNSIKNRKRLYSILPLELAPQLVEYSRSSGLISNYVKKNISNRITYNIKNKGIINKRIEILNNQAKLALKLKHSDFTAFFDYGYKSRSGIFNKGLYVMRKIRNSKIFKGHCPW